MKVSITLPNLIIKKAYEKSASLSESTTSLSKIEQEWLEIIVDKSESQKAVIAVLITSLVKKIETPSQDIRYHKTGLLNGYSGRTFDTKFITPFINEKFPRISMKSGSGWLTRSLEQAHPFTLDFPGKIRAATVKKAFLEILNDIEVNNAKPEKYLQAIFALLREDRSKSEITFQMVPFNAITVESVIKLLRAHFFHVYGVSGASRLPVLAIYTVYELLMEIDRYKNKTLLSLKNHTTSDLKSGSIGDIEILDKHGEFFEAVEIKHNIAISGLFVQNAFEKFVGTKVRRYYLLTTANPNVDDKKAVQAISLQIRKKHGCEIIVNGIIPSLKYYLRLLGKLDYFLEQYAKNLRLDFDRNAELKKVHLHYWNELLSSL